MEQGASVEEERWSDLRYNLQDRQELLTERKVQRRPCSLCLLPSQFMP